MRAAGEQHVPTLNGMMRGSAVRQQIPNVLTYVPGRRLRRQCWQLYWQGACGVFAEQKSLTCGIVESKQNPLAHATPPARFKMLSHGHDGRLAQRIPSRVPKRRIHWTRMTWEMTIYRGYTGKNGNIILITNGHVLIASLPLGSFGHSSASGQAGHAPAAFQRAPACDLIQVSEHSTLATKVLASGTAHPQNLNKRSPKP